VYRPSRFSVMFYLKVRKVPGQTRKRGSAPIFLRGIDLGGRAASAGKIAKPRDYSSFRGVRRTPITKCAKCVASSSS
jgi:hypothetical protein